nr:DUF2812 domain-containing protein [Lachnospiraceae bacterium]
MGTENIKWCISKRESKYDKNKKHKSEFKFQSPEKLEHYFEEMALNGWKLVEIRFGNCYVFEECRPVRLRFMVNILEIISFTRKDAEEKNRDFLEFCENKGWDYVYHTNSVAVFCTEDKEIQKVEIEDISIMNRKYRLIFSATTLIINIIFAFTYTPLDIFCTHINFSTPLPTLYHLLSIQ